MVIRDNVLVQVTNDDIDNYGVFTVPDKVIKIGEYAFKDCLVKIVNITSSVVEIGKSAFFMCRNLKEVSIWEGLKIIDDDAFSWCTSLFKINIPNSVTTIGKRAFFLCYGLKTIYIPVTTEKIGDEAFSHCYFLEKAIIPKNIVNIPAYLFASCESLKEVILPDNLKSIGENAFSLCSSLKQIKIPDTVTTIERRAFHSSSIESIVLPKKLQEIGVNAFAICNELKDLTISNNYIFSEDEIFARCYSLKNITVLNGLSYETISKFSGLKDININLDTSLFSIDMSALNEANVNTLTIYNHTFTDINDAIDNLSETRKEELMYKIKSELLNNKIKNNKCFKISEHRKFIDKIIKNLEEIDEYDYRPDFNSYIKDYIDKHKEEIINIEDALKEIQNCEPNYNELKKYPYIISTLLLNIKISYSKNEETIKLKKVLSKLTKIELNNPSDFVKLFLKLFFDSDEGVIINKVSINKLINYSKKQIKILEEQNKTYETLKEIIRVYLKKAKECEINLKVSEDLKNLESSKEEAYLNYEQITNEIDYNFSCIMKLKQITSVIIPGLLNYYSLNKVIIKRREEIEILSNILNELNNILETKENRINEKDSLIPIEENKEKVMIK